MTAVTLSEKGMMAARALDAFGEAIRSQSMTDAIDRAVAKASLGTIADRDDRVRDAVLGEIVRLIGEQREAWHHYAVTARSIGDPRFVAGRDDSSSSATYECWTVVDTWSGDIVWVSSLAVESPLCGLDARRLTQLQDRARLEARKLNGREA